MKTLLAMLLALFLGGLPCARGTAPLAADDAAEKRTLTIAGELRCLVCQNETLADSQARLAQDLRREIRKQIGQGKGDPEILDFMTSRYGDFVRYRPPLKTATYLLWFGPFLLLITAISGLFVYLRRRGRRIGNGEHCENSPQAGTHVDNIM